MFLRKRKMLLALILSVGVMCLYALANAFAAVAKYSKKHDVESISTEHIAKANEILKLRDQSSIQAYESAEYVTHRSFVTSQDSTIFILGAVGKNSSESAKWDTYTVYGQWYHHEQVQAENLRCCFRYEDGTADEKSITDFYTKDYPHELINNAVLVLWHVTCLLPDDKIGKRPSVVSVAREMLCVDVRVNYVVPFFAKLQPPDHLVITTKFAYGKLDPEIVVSFLEHAKYMGADKVIVYKHESLDPAANKVLLYYASLGFVDYNVIQLADSRKVVRYVDHSNAQYVSDEWLVQRDALERSSGSTYFGIFDMDEFLIPSTSRSWKQLMATLSKAYPECSHFFFKNVHYLTNIPSECKQNCSLFKRYTWTSPEVFNNLREKMIMLISRVHTGTVNNHYIASKPGFKSGVCPERLGYLRHYGLCHRHFGDKCKDTNYKLLDLSMIEWTEKNTHKHIAEVMQKLDQNDQYMKTR